MNPDSIPATALILTRNSAATLRRALDSVEDFDDILICDGGSTDDTCAIAREFGARTIEQERTCLNEDGSIRNFACVRNAALKEALYPWVLSIDSDESASEGLVAEIRVFLAGNPPPGVCRTPARIILDGTPIFRSSNYPGYQVRFFHRDAGRYKKPLHERFTPHSNVPIRTLTSPWQYYIESRTYNADYGKDLPHHLAIYVEGYKNAPARKRMRGTYRALRAMLGIAIRAIYNNIVHPGPNTYPLSYEWVRIRYQWEIIKAIWRTLSK
ncbi:hypothetical protein COU20_02365 [Candidatus Kaiserbacteria bacterium CG10_big_fil_rev_8_21_14_0_10_59_10]|uniref:Glycosyltransferase 2-like domain-containing protein n=1 Tax=Candidatus Kaiserbacteria bacterium CG10_big_fil_rev_8_21_14_0_10_59_10 TaxID=1974612 RepID=A0A2H0U7Q9_9BACT|nr:MAG: hypothetical protein COU20_02365 [Candidatus Kaiserbacteria bacterium CG10_big_fil_rev_8_21_14_0_10_59_10]